MAKKTKPRFWTTEVDAAKSVAEIGELLRKHGVRRCTTDWDSNGEPVAILFTMPVAALEGRHVPVRLAAQTLPLQQRMREAGVRGNLRAQACRVAWRQLKAWIEMSLEAAANGVKPFHEVFLADVVLDPEDPEGGRVADLFEKRASALLGDGAG